MRELPLGEAIRRRREELGLTQDQVCEGICEPMTLSRLENGKQNLSYNRLRALLQRLNMPEARYYALLTPYEMKLKTARKEMLSRSSRFNRAEGDEKKRAWALAIQQLDKLEALAEKDDTITRQFILSHRATLGTADGPYPFEARLSMLLKALRLTVPKFNLEKIGGRRYSMDETQLINQVAATYSNAGDHETATALYRQLYTYLRRDTDNLPNYAPQLTLNSFNYARELTLCEYYHEAIKVAEDGKSISVNYAYYQFLPGFLTLLAECHYLLGEKIQSKERYLQAHYLYEALEDRYSLSIIDPDIRDRFGIEFPLFE